MFKSVMGNFSFTKGKIAIGLAATAALYAVYGAVSGFHVPGEVENIEAEKQVAQLDPVNIRVLTNTHLFGQPPRKAAAVKPNANGNVNSAGGSGSTRVAGNQQRPKPQPKPKPKPKPIKINVQVTGILASNDADYAAAILKVDNKPEKLFKIGEDLGKPEVTLQSVEREGVVLDNNGSEQQIAMKRPALESSKSAKQQSNRNNSNNRNQVNNVPANQIPEIPDDLELIGGQDTAAIQGAFTPQADSGFDQGFDQTLEELEEELLSESIEQDLDEELLKELEGVHDANSRGTGPNFQLPAF